MFIGGYVCSSMLFTYECAYTHTHARSFVQSSSNVYAVVIVVVDLFCVVFFSSFSSIFFIRFEIYVLSC